MYKSIYFLHCLAYLSIYLSPGNHHWQFEVWLHFRLSSSTVNRHPLPSLLSSTITLSTSRCYPVVFLLLFPAWYLRRSLSLNSLPVPMIFMYFFVCLFKYSSIQIDLGDAHRLRRRLFESWGSVWRHRAAQWRHVARDATNTCALAGTNVCRDYLTDTVFVRRTLTRVHHTGPTAVQTNSDAMFRWMNEWMNLFAWQNKSKSSRNAEAR